MAPGYETGRDKLLKWYGAPGTGKSYALSALAYAWREWASFTYVADPDALLGDTAYLLEWMTLRDPRERWRVAILEDTGELFGADAGRRTGQGLARLLNATDGMLAKGSKTLFVITTNEPISHFHHAVVRPGRCVSRVEFEALSVASSGSVRPGPRSSSDRGLDWAERGSYPRSGGGASPTLWGGPLHGSMMTCGRMSTIGR